MKIPIWVYFVLTTFLILSNLTYGQTTSNEFIVPDFNEEGKYINEYISGNYPDRVYVLKRDGLYLLSSTIVNNGWTLRIKAASGSGEMPAIYCVRNPSNGKVPSPMFEGRNNIWMKGIAAVGYLDSDPDKFSDMTGNVIVMKANDYSIVIDSCIFSTTKSSHIQTPNRVKTVKVTNSIFSNGGSIALNNFGNGRGIDLRDVSCDSLIVQNTTFINLQDRPVRHHVTSNQTGFRSIEHFIFDHNTITNVMGCHGNIFLSLIGKSSVITNNLFIDNMVLGDDVDPVRETYFTNNQELNEFGSPCFTMIYSVPNDTTNWIVRNNYMATTPALQSWYDGEHSEDSTFTGTPDPLTYNINSRLGNDSVNAFKTISISDNFFVKNTNTPIAMADWYRTPPPSGPGKQKNTTGFSSATDYDRRVWQFFADTLDLAYDTTSSAHKGTDGFPAGDLNWFPELKAEWEKTVEPVGINETGKLPGDFHLQQNYPNPFNPSTKIVYNVPGESKIKLKVFDILGRTVTTLVDDIRSTGQYEINFDASDLTSGVYFYQLTTPSQAVTKKMLLLR